MSSGSWFPPPGTTGTSAEASAATATAAESSTTTIVPAAEIAPTVAHQVSDSQAHEFTSAVARKVGIARERGIASGTSVVVGRTAGADILLVRSKGGAYSLGVNAGSSDPNVKASGQPIRTEGFCHAAAMAAVYALGSVGLAALAASGGGMVLGVFITAEAANAMSLALAGGSAVSGLVSLYIC